MNLEFLHMLNKFKARGSNYSHEWPFFNFNFLNECLHTDFKPKAHENALCLIQKDNTYKDRWCLLQSPIFPKLHFAEKYLCTSLRNLTTVCNQDKLDS